MDDEATESLGGVLGKRQGNSKYHRTHQSDGTFLTLRHAFGVAGGIRDNVAFVAMPDPEADGAGLTLGYLVHPVGQQIALHRVDDGSMKFLTGRQKNVREILALGVSPNKRVIAVCERGRAPEEDPGNAQVSVYHVATCKRIRTMLFPGRGDFIACSFSGDNRSLVAASTEPESSIVVWNWDKEKVEKTAQNNGFSATRVAFNPGDHGFFTTSGPMHLRLWYTSSDNVLKAHTILPQSKEQEHFADHTWIAGSAGQPTRMIAITDGEGTGSSSGGCHQRGSSILVFDAVDGSPYLELKQTLQAPLPLTSRLETLMPFSKGFIVAGGGINGYLGVYENMDDQRDPYMWIKSFSAKGAVLTGLALNRSSEMMYVYSRTNEILTFNLGNMDVLEDDGNHFYTLLQGGNHTATVVTLDVCLTKPIIVTIGEDRVLRIWSYQKWRCEVVHEFRNEDPNCTSLHPTGFQVAVGFKDRIRIYSVLMEGLRLLRDIPQKNCRAVAYSHGGHLLAVASGFSVAVYAAITAQQVHNFTGHIAAITLVRWAPRDNIVFSTGQDGNVYGWDLQTGGRVDDCVALNRPHSYHAMELRLSDKREGANVVAVCGTESVIREISWGGSLHKEHVVRDVRLDTSKQFVKESSDVRSLLFPQPGVAHIAQDEPLYVTCMATSMSGKNVFCGTNTGRVRVYDWPLPQETPPCFELPVHAGAVTALAVSPDDNFIFTCGEDGSVFVLGAKVMERGIQIRDAEDPDPRAFDTDAVLVSQEEIEEQFGQVAELNKTMEDMKSEHAFALHRKTAELLDELKQTAEENESKLASKDARFEMLHQKHESLKREHVDELDKKDRHHFQVTQELENQYEHRLAVELDRYDRLSEEVEAVQQRCEGLLEAQQQEHQWELRAREQAARKMEKELRQQIERLQEDKNYNDQMYREVLDQQEGEYETELQQLITAAEAELHSERENTGKLRATLQTRKTKEDQLRKKMQETQRSSSAREMMFALEKAKRERLEATMHHFEQHMHQRELTLAEKEKTILELRSNNTTLDNFRFVLDHRLQQLMEERGPITAHIEGLEAHIRGMYDELVSEFAEKKDVARVLEQKELKLAGLSQEVSVLRSQVRSKDRVIFGFKRELSSIVHIGLPKDLEQAVKEAYKKFVQGEDIVAKPARRRHSNRTGGTDDSKAGGTNASGTGGAGGNGNGGGGRGGGGGDGKDKGRGGGRLGGNSSKVEGGGGEDNGALLMAGIDDDMKGGAGDTDGDSEGSWDSRDYGRGDGGGGRRGRGGGEDAANLVAQTREAHRQREFMEKKQNELVAKLADAKLAAVKQQRAKLTENSALISECNSLRKENTSLKRKNEILRLEAKEMAARPNNCGVWKSRKRPIHSHGSPRYPPSTGPLDRSHDGTESKGDEWGRGSLQTDDGLSQQVRSLGDTTSVTLIPTPETETSFLSSPPPWDPSSNAEGGPETSAGGENSARGQNDPNRGDVGHEGAVGSKTSQVQGGSGRLKENCNAKASTRKHPRQWQQQIPNAGMATDQQRRQQRQQKGPVNLSLLSSSASLNNLQPASQHSTRHLLRQNRCRTLGQSASGGGMNRPGACGLSWTAMAGPPKLVKGGTRSLHAKASFAGDILRLERALDGKERELQLQRGENSTLRERLRVLESHQSNGHSKILYSPGGGGGGGGARGESSASPPSLLAPPWGGSGRGGTAPYPDANQSRPVSPGHEWVANQAGMTEGNAVRSSAIRSAMAKGSSSAPPGAHVPALRGEVGGSAIDPELFVAPARVKGSASGT